MGKIGKPTQLKKINVFRTQDLDFGRIIRNTHCDTYLGIPK